MAPFVILRFCERDSRDGVEWAVGFAPFPLPRNIHARTHTHTDTHTQNNKTRTDLRLISLDWDSDCLCSTDTIRNSLDKTNEVGDEEHKALWATIRENGLGSLLH